MKKFFTMALVCLSAVAVVTASSLAANGNKASGIHNSTAANGGPTNQVSYGPEAYAYQTIGDKIEFAPNAARSLSNVTVTLSSWACQSGNWTAKNCVTQPGAMFSQEMTLSVYKVTEDGTKGALIASSTETFSVPYRPSASPKCTGDDAG